MAAPKGYGRYVTVQGLRFRVWRSWSALLGLAIGVMACTDEAPTALDDTLLPPEPVTVELRLDWTDFASGFEILGGYGAPREIGTGVVARGFEATLNARTLARFGAFPEFATVRDTTGTARADSSLVFVGGRVVVVFDTIASTNDVPVTLELGAIQDEWDINTVTWTNAIDTINDLRPWPEAGAGAVVSLATAEWDPATGDSLFLELDSTQVAAWADPTDLSRGARLDLATDGFRLEVASLALQLDTRPSSNPDTLVQLTIPRQDLTFVYDPFPNPPPDGIRVGGAPAWRTVMDVTVPQELNGPAELCAVVACPYRLRPEDLTYAALVLASRRTDAGFQPTDSIGLDVRPVLSRAALPKSPLGPSLIGLLGRRFGPDLFGDEEGTVIEIPITPFARDLLLELSPGQLAPPNTLALLSTFEPVSISFASFFGPGSAFEPTLRMIVTAGPAVQLP